MLHFFYSQTDKVFAVQTGRELSATDISKLEWLFGDAKLKQETTLSGIFVGPRAAMITPWSTNAVEITQNMGIQGIIRIEELKIVEEDFMDFDPMLSQKYKGLDQDIFTIHVKPEPVLPVTDIEAHNKQEGLSLSDEEVDYLNKLAERLGRQGIICMGATFRCSTPGEPFKHSSLLFCACRINN